LNVGFSTVLLDIRCVCDDEEEEEEEEAELNHHEYQRYDGH